MTYIVLVEVISRNRAGRVDVHGARGHVNTASGRVRSVESKGKEFPLRRTHVTVISVATIRVLSGDCAFGVDAKNISSWSEPVPALGSSNVVMVPSGERSKP